MQPVGVDIESGIRLDHAVEMKIVPASTEVTKHPIMGVGRRGIWMHRPCNKTHCFSPSTQHIYVGSVEAHFVVAPKHNAEFS